MGCIQGVSVAIDPPGVPVLVVSGSQGPMDATPWFGWVRDEGGRLTLSDVLGERGGWRWAREAGRVPSFGFTDDVFWLRLRLRNDATNGVPCIVELGSTRFAELDWHAVRGTNVVAAERMGLMRPRTPRRLDSRLPCFAVDLGPRDEVDVYLRAWTQASVYFPITVHPGLDAHAAARLKAEAWTLAGAGLMAAVMATGLLFGLLLGERLYLINAGLVLVHGLFCFIHAGYWTWMDGPWATEVVWLPLTVLNHVCSFMAAWFTREFIGRGSLGRISYRVLTATMWGTLAMAAGLLLLPYRGGVRGPVAPGSGEFLAWLRSSTLPAGGVNTVNVAVFLLCAWVATAQWLVRRSLIALSLALMWTAALGLRLLLGLQWQGVVPLLLPPSLGLMWLFAVTPVLFMVMTAMRILGLARERHRAHEMVRALNEARFSALRYQMNPHFLFNALNSANGLLLEGAARVPGFLVLLARFLRSSLDGPPEGRVTFRRELDLATDYVAIEKVRFEDSLVVDVDVPDAALACEVPEFLLQPLIENAIRHGARDASQVLRVQVRAWLERSQLCVTVANTGRLARDGSRLDAADRKGRGGLGLSNLRERMGLLFGGRFTMEVFEDPGWVVVRLRMPIRVAASDPAMTTEART